MTTISFLTITFLLYVIINTLKNLHGKCIIGFLFSSIVACIFNISSRLVWITKFANLENAQKYSSYFLFSKLALIFAFLWINVMIFDVWWVLRYVDEELKFSLKFLILKYFSQLLQIIIWWKIQVLLLLRWFWSMRSSSDHDLTQCCCFIRLSSYSHLSMFNLLYFRCIENLWYDWSRNRIWQQKVSLWTTKVHDLLPPFHTHFCDLGHRDLSFWV